MLGSFGVPYSQIFSFLHGNAFGIKISLYSWNFVFSCNCHGNVNLIAPDTFVSIVKGFVEFFVWS